jgi:hypothetical protein
VDYNGDSYLDIFATSFERPSGGGVNLLYRNNGDMTFTDVAAEAGLTRDTIENRTCAWADYDGDGFLDVFFTRSSGLYKNNGDGTFTDVTAAAGIIVSDDAQSGAWGDYDNDGDLDLYVTLGEASGGRGASAAEDPDEVTEAMPFRQEITPTPTPTPINNILYRNNGDGTFTDVTTASGAINNIDALGVTWGDYDNNGYLDLYIVNTDFRSANRLFLNNGDGTFTDVAHEAGVEGKIRQSRGSDASFFDYNNDGFLDLFLCNGAGTTTGPYVLFRNNGNSNKWLKIVLKGRQSNRSGIGAKILLTAGGQTQFREYTGQHYMGQNYVPIHFGLGQAAIVDSLTIKWPSGVTRTLHNIAVNQTITIREARR